MRYHHVAKRPHGFVKRRARTKPQRLRNVNLHVIDEVAVPDRLEKTVRETERQNVLRGLLAEKVIDAENLIFFEDLVQLGVQRHGACKVGAEWLFHDDSRALDQACRAQQAHGRQGGSGRHTQVVQAPALAAEGLLRLVDRGLEYDGAGCERHVIKILGKGIPSRWSDLAGRELLECRAHEATQAFRVEIIQRHADDSAARNEPRADNMKQPRPEFAPRKITRRAHEYDDLWILRALPG